MRGLGEGHIACACDRHRTAAGATAKMHDPVSALGHFRRADETRHRDALVDDLTRRRSGQQDRAAFRSDPTPGLDQRLAVRRPLRHLIAGQEADQPVTVEIETEGVGGAHGHAPVARLNQPIVRDVRRDEGHHAGVLRDDRAVVDDRSERITLLVKPHRSLGVHERLRPDAGRRHDQPGRIDLRALPEQHALTVDDVDLSVRRDRAHDLGGVRPHHTVQRRRCLSRLVEDDAFARGVAEIRPVDHRLVRGLIDGDCLAALPGDVGASPHNLTAGRIGEGGALAQQRHTRGGRQPDGDSTALDLRSRGALQAGADRQIHGHLGEPGSRNTAGAKPNLPKCVRSWLI